MICFCFLLSRVGCTSGPCGKCHLQWLPLSACQHSIRGLWCHRKGCWGSPGWPGPTAAAACWEAEWVCFLQETALSDWWWLHCSTCATILLYFSLFMLESIGSDLILPHSQRRHSAIKLWICSRVSSDMQPGTGVISSGCVVGASESVPQVWRWQGFSRGDTCTVLIQCRAIASSSSCVVFVFAGWLIFHSFVYVDLSLSSSLVGSEVVSLFRGMIYIW